MKVLVYTSLFPNHIQPNKGIFIKHRVLHFAKLPGCHIKVVAPVPYSPAWRFLGERYAYSKIRSHEDMEVASVFHPRYLLIPKVSMLFHGVFLFLTNFLLVKRIYDEFRFDIIDGHYIYPDGLAAVLLGKAMKKPVVLSARGSDIHTFTGFKLILPMIKYALKEADHIVSVCEALKSEMIEMGVPAEKISTIPNGVDTKDFAMIERSEARRQLDISENQKILLSVGSLLPVKGFHVLLEALNIVLQNVNVHLYIIGEGPERGFLTAKIEKLGLGGKVTLLGERPNSELKAWYNAADVFCLASSREGWANVIMESLACGTPVVATGVWGAPEIITSQNMGLLVEQTPKSIAGGLVEGLGRKWDRNCIRKAIANRTWDLVAAEVKEVFESVLRRM